jgi:hypothetical protein
MIGYGGIAIIVFWIVVLKMWIQHGPKIPLIGIGIYFVFYLGVRVLPRNPIPFELLICFLGIGLLLIDRVKSNPWR